MLQNKLQAGICTMYLLLQKHVRSFICTNFVGSISCLHPIKAATANALTQVASGSEEETIQYIASEHNLR